MQQALIVVGNLPDDVTEPDIRAAFRAFADADAIRLDKERGGPMVVIGVSVSRAQARYLARRINGRLYQGRVLSAWVPRVAP